MLKVCNATRTRLCFDLRTFVGGVRDSIIIDPGQELTLKDNEASDQLHRAIASGSLKASKVQAQRVVTVKKIETVAVKKINTMDVKKTHIASKNKKSESDKTQSITKNKEK